MALDPAEHFSKWQIHTNPRYGVQKPKVEDALAMAELVRKNILLQTALQQIVFASPLVRRYFLSCVVQRPPPLNDTDVPLLSVEQGVILNFPKLVIEIVKDMNPLEKASACRKKQYPASKMAGRAILPDRKATYVRHFTSTMMHLVKL